MGGEGGGVAHQDQEKIYQRDLVVVVVLEVLVVVVGGVGCRLLASYCCSFQKRVVLPKLGFLVVAVVGIGMMGMAVVVGHQQQHHHQTPLEVVLGSYFPCLMALVLVGNHQHHQYRHLAASAVVVVVVGLDEEDQR